MPGHSLLVVTECPGTEKKPGEEEVAGSEIQKLAGNGRNR